MIHSTAQISDGAFVSSNARIGASCQIADGAFIGENVVLEEGCKVGRGALLEGKIHAGPGVEFQANVHIVNSGGQGLVLGAQCIIRSFAVLYDDIVMGTRVRVGHHSILRPKSSIGDEVSIGNLNQLEGHLAVGARTRFHSNVHISMYSRIGSDCFIAPGFVPTNTPYPLTPLAEEYTPGVTIADAVKIGANVTTAPGVTIGRNSLIGLGSVVLHDVMLHSLT